MTPPPREPKAASASGLTSEELATSEEGRRRLRAAGGERDSRASGMAELELSYKFSAGNFVPFDIQVADLYRAG